MIAARLRLEHVRADGFDPGRRVRVERGIYRQANGKLRGLFHAGRQAAFPTVGTDLELARAQRAALVRAARFRVVAAVAAVAPETVSG
jgi:transposase